MASFMGGMGDQQNVVASSMSMANTFGSMTGYNPYAMIAGGIIGAGLGGFNNIAQHKANAAQYNQQAYTTQAQIDQLNLQNEQIDDWLANYEDYYNQQMSQQYLAGRQTYAQLAGVASDMLVANSAAGHVGGSSALVAQQAGDDLEYYFGSDRSIDGDDGLYGSAVAMLRHGLENEKKYAQQAREINLDTISELKSTYDSLKKKEKKEKEKSKWYNQAISIFTGGLFG